MRKWAYMVLLAMVVLIACQKDMGLAEPGGTERVVLDLDSVPYSTLSHYQFFSGNMADQQPADGVLPFAPITPLFSDYAHKKRFVWMPPGTQATYQSDGTVLDFPDGAVLIKSFYYDHVQPENTRQLLETRLMIRRDDVWIFADYIWNEDQTEAFFDVGGAYRSLIYKNDADEMRCETYRIPSEAECHTCHKLYDQNTPIGPKPQSLNSAYHYPDGVMNQLAKWESVGYLASGYPQNITTTVRWDDTTQSLNDRVRGYVDMNCSHCHSEGRHCDYRPMRFAWSETTDPTNLGECVVPDDVIDASQTHIVARGNAARSMMYYRISSNEEAVRMPLMGRDVLHTEAVQLVHDWINSLSPPCP